MQTLRPHIGLCANSQKSFGKIMSRTVEDYETIPQISAEDMFLEYCCDACNGTELLYQKIISYNMVASWHRRNNISWVIRCKPCKRTLAFVQEPKISLEK